MAKFQGRIVVVLNESEAEKAVNFLLTCNILGIDTETRPSFKKGQQHKVSLLQVSTHDICFLFRLKLIKQKSSIIRLLENKDVPMVGLSLHDDVMSLNRLFDFTPGNFIDLQNLVKTIGIEDLSLQKLYANFFHQRISKSQQLSNWDADILNEKQRLYAATDAWACIQIYEEYRRLSESRDFNLINNDKDEQLSENIS
jgi:ribonuclease D